MIQNLKLLDGFTIGAPDGRIGKVNDAYFDDCEWAVRYLVVDTGTWLRGRTVLVSPLFLQGIDWEADAVHATLTREEVKASPGLEFDEPVSRQHEAELYSHYGIFGYWVGPFVWGVLPYPGATVGDADVPGRLRSRVHRDDRKVDDSHLRSAREVRGYDIQAFDGAIGHVDDFLFDDETWLIESLIVDTRNWLPGRDVTIPPDWIEEVDWAKHAAYVRASRETIRRRPEYAPLEH